MPEAAADWSVLTDRELNVLIEFYEVSIERAKATWIPNQVNAGQLRTISLRLDQLLQEHNRRHPAEAPSGIVAPGGGLLVPGR